MKVYSKPREKQKKTMLDRFKNSKKNIISVKYEALTDTCDFIDQKLGGFLNFTKESLERCEVLSKQAYVDSNLYTLLVFWMTKFMEFFATVIFEAINNKIEEAIRRGKQVKQSSPKGKFEWNIFKKKSKQEFAIIIEPILSSDTVQLFRAIYMLVFRFNAKNQRFMEKIRASNYFSECDQIRGKIFDMLKDKTNHLVNSILNEVSYKVVARVSHPDFVKIEKTPRIIEQFILHFGKFYREVGLLANSEVILRFKLDLFVNIHSGIQKALLTISKSLFKKVII